MRDFNEPEGEGILKEGKGRRGERRCEILKLIYFFILVNILSFTLIKSNTLHNFIKIQYSIDFAKLRQSCFVKISR